MRLKRTKLLCVECKKNKFDVCTEIELITQQVKNGRLGGWGSVMDVFPLRTWFTDLVQHGGCEFSKSLYMLLRHGFVKISWAQKYALPIIPSHDLTQQWVPDQLDCAIRDLAIMGTCLFLSLFRNNLSYVFMALCNLHSVYSLTCRLADSHRK